MTRSRKSSWTLPLVVAGVALSAQPAAATTSEPVAPTAKPGQSQPYGARLALCRRSLRAEKRTAVVAVTMRPIEDAARFAVKIDLYERPLAGGRWTLRTDVPGLGHWTAPSDPTIGSRSADVYKLRQAVNRLVVQYAYRFRVAFRWYDAEDELLREATATTRGCRQIDLRPDLRITHARARPSARFPGLVRYVVSVRNDGRTVARGVVVAATLPGEASADRSARVARIEAGELADVAFTGPGCAAEDPAPPSFAVDPADAIDEVDEADNGFALVCPVP
jgi:uncharacterized repeat protein (TIGR01451 family)